MKKIIALSALLFCFSVSSTSFMERSPFDTNFRSHLERTKTHEVLIIPYFAFSGHGRNSLGDKVNPLQSLQASQNALAMVKGFPTGSVEDQIAQQINIDGDNAAQGHFVINGNYSFTNTTFGYSYHVAHEWFLRFRIPFITANIGDVTWQDQTQNMTLDDQLIHQLVTDNLFSNVQTFGDLHLCRWSNRGMGDLTTYAQWERVFLQEKAWLKEVGINTRLGLSLPTGKKKNEDFAFAMAFGNDGAWAVPFGAGIDLKFKKFLRAGIDVSFEHIFSHTKERRIMTDPSQTDFLFLQKADSRKEYGITQMFNLYLEPQLMDQMTVRCAYQHTKHATDRLYVLGNEYSSVIANQAAGLKEWTTHSVFLQARYDNQGTRGLISPIVSVFTQIPFNGKRSLNAPSVGFNLTFQF